MKSSIKPFMGIILSIAVMGVTACESLEYNEEFKETHTTEEVAVPEVASDSVSPADTTSAALDDIKEVNDETFRRIEELTRELDEARDALERARADEDSALEDRIAELEDELERARRESETGSDPVVEGEGIPDDLVEHGTPAPAERPELGARLNPDVINFRPYIKTTLNIPTESSEYQDIDRLMKETFEPDDFTDYEVEVQTKLMTALEAIQPASLRNALKQYVIAVVRELIRVQRAEGIGGVVEISYWKDLGNILTAYKSGDREKAASAVHNSVLPDLTLENQTRAVTDPKVLKQAGAYLQLQFAEAYKDIVKASNQGGGEIHSSSTMAVEGGGGPNNLNMVYWCCAATGGRNHINGLANADMWYQSRQHWSGVAVALFNALAWERLKLSEESVSGNVKQLMKNADTLNPNTFNDVEMSVQEDVINAYNASGPTSAHRQVLKNYVIAEVRGLILLQRMDGRGGVISNSKWKELATVIAAYKSGDAEHVAEVITGGPLADLNNGASADMLKASGAYLELQFAEAYKDMIKASRQGRSEIYSASTMAVNGGGEAANWGLVYSCCGLDAGNNHINGLANADMWHQGQSNWRGVATAIWAALAQAQL